jgi:PAS domain S-box-containing protein
LIASAARQLCDYLNVTSVYICSWQRATGQSEVLAEHISTHASAHENEPSVGYSYSLRRDFPEIDMWLQEDTGSLTLQVDDPTLSPEVKAYYLDNGVKTAFYVPILVEDQIFGYAEIYESREPRQYTDHQLAFANTIANQVGISINNRQLFRSLQASEHRFRGLIENTNELITVLDEDGTVQYISPTVTTMLGYPETQLMGKNIFAIIHEDDREDLIKEITAARENPGINFISSFRMHHKNRTWVHLEATGSMTLDENGNARNYISSRDVTAREKRSGRDREQFERRGKQATFINRIATQIGTISTRSDLYQLAVNSLQRDLDPHYHLASFYRFAAASNELVLATAAGPGAQALLQRGHTLAMNQGSVGRAGGRLKTLLIPNTSYAVDWVATPGIEGTRSEIATPVHLGNTLLGVLIVQSTEFEDVDLDLELLMEALSSLIAVTSESIRLRIELEEQLEELNALQRSTTPSAWQAFGQALPARPAGFEHHPTRDDPQPIEKTATEPAATVKPMQVRGEKIGLIGIDTDPNKPLTADEQALLEEITAEVSEALERARLFEASQRSAAELAVLNEMGNAFTEALNEKAIIENIFKYASQLIEIDDFYVAMYDEIGHMISFPLAEINNVRISPGHPDWTSWQPRPAGTGLTGFVIEQRQPVLIQNNAEEVLNSLGLPYIQIGQMTQSWVGVPMTIGDRALGMINAQSDERPGLYNEHHLGLLTSIASQAAIAIDNARLFNLEQKRAEQERLVRTITDRVRRGADMQSILRITLEEIGQAMGVNVSIAQLGTREQLRQTKEQPKPPLNTANSNNGVNGHSEEED